MTQDSAKPHFPRPTEEARQQHIRTSLETARLWHADPLSVTLDTETTSLTGYVWDFAAVPVGRLTGGLPAPLLAFLCAPPEGCEWSQEARAIAAPRLHLIPPSSIEGHAPAVLDLMRRYRVLAYNADFDGPRLAFTLREAGCVSDFPKPGCLAELYAPLAGRWSESRGRWKTVKLDEACAALGVDISDLPRHSGYGDAVAADRVLVALAHLPLDTPGQVDA